MESETKEVVDHVGLSLQLVSLNATLKLKEERRSASLNKTQLIAQLNMEMPVVTEDGWIPLSNTLEIMVLLLKPIILTLPRMENVMKKLLENSMLQDSMILEVVTNQPKKVPIELLLQLLMLPNGVYMVVVSLRIVLKTLITVLFWLVLMILVTGKSEIPGLLHGENQVT